MALTNEQMKSLSTFEFQVLLKKYENDLLPESDPTYGRVAKVANRLINSNADVEQIHGKDWTISVVQGDARNAEVLPSGNIFVFTGTPRGGVRGGQGGGGPPQYRVSTRKYQDKYFILSIFSGRPLQPNGQYLCFILNHIALSVSKNKNQ